MKGSISKKLWAGFFSILLIMGIIGWVTISSTNKISKEYEILLDERVHKVNLAEQLIHLQKDSHISLNNFVIHKSTQYLRQREDVVEQAEQTKEDINSMFVSKHEVALLEEIVELQTLYNEKIEETRQVVINGTDRSAQRLALEASDLSNNLILKAEELKVAPQQEMLQKRNELESLLNNSKFMTITLLLVAFILSIFISIALSRNIAKPVGRITAAIERIADGDLSSEPIIIRNRDEIGTMATSFNKMSDDLKELLSRIHLSSHQLATQAEQLSASSEESLASSEMVATVADENMRGSEKQTFFIDDTLISMLGLEEGVTQIVNSNNDMLASSRTVAELVTNGSNIVSEVSSQMNNIHAKIGQSSTIIRQMAEQAGNIQRVTAIITEISEQTNLLALNAAIEAARAGEHGLGFAVVAEEVRRLAEQSKNSATEIESMMNTIQEETEKAVLSINEGSQSVNTGLTSSRNSLDIFQEIEKAVSEVDVKVASVSTVIEQMQAVTKNVANSSREIKKLAETAAQSAQKTSATTEEQLAVSEEISASSQSLAEVAETLQSEVNRFNLIQHESPTSAEEEDDTLSSEEELNLSTTRRD